MDGAGQRLDQRPPTTRNLVGQLEGIGAWNANQLGTSSVACHADRIPVLAEVEAAHPAEPAVTAKHIGIDRYEVAFAKVGDLAPDGDNFTAELVPRHDRVAREGEAPFQHVNVGATDATDLDRENRL